MPPEADKKQEYPFFMRLCWTLNTLRLSRLAAALRRWAHWRARFTLSGKLRDPSWVSWKHYDHPEDVGYRGWIEHERHGVLAFARMDDSLQFEW